MTLSRVLPKRSWTHRTFFIIVVNISKGTMNLSGWNFLMFHSQDDDIWGFNSMKKMKMTWWFTFSSFSGFLFRHISLDWKTDLLLTLSHFSTWIIQTFSSVLMTWFPAPACSTLPPSASLYLYQERFICLICLHLWVLPAPLPRLALFAGTLSVHLITFFKVPSKVSVCV